MKIHLLLYLPLLALTACGSSSSTTPAQDAANAAQTAKDAAAYKLERASCREKATSCQEAVECIRTAAVRRNHTFKGYCSPAGDSVIGEDDK